MNVVIGPSMDVVAVVGWQDGSLDDKDESLIRVDWKEAKNSCAEEAEFTNSVIKFVQIEKKTLVEEKTGKHSKGMLLFKTPLYEGDYEFQFYLSSGELIGTSQKVTITKEILDKSILKIDEKMKSKNDSSFVVKLKIKETYGTNSVADIEVTLPKDSDELPVNSWIGLYNTLDGILTHKKRGIKALSWNSKPSRSIR
jgi:hypothetical protein